MDSKTRLLTAWSFREPDRVPIEMYLYPPARELPDADKIAAFQRDEADNFCAVPGFDWGFLGLDTTCSEEVIEDVPGQFKRLLRTHRTPAGDFTSITKHVHGDADPHDFHWEKRFIATVEDFRRIALAQRHPRPFNAARYNEGCARVGARGLPCTGLFHPLGSLVRNSAMDEVYSWMMTEERLMTRYLDACAEQVCASMESLREAKPADPPVFMTYALEMLIPPWLGPSHFDRMVFPFDRRINDAIHRIGGRHRAHCHGNSGEFLERFADMGVDAVEPLEPPPYADNSLARAKKLVGRRMLLSGNVISQAFALDTFQIADVRDLVKQAIDEGAPGGGFTLKTTGGAVGNGKTREQCIKSIRCALAMIEAWREFSSCGTAATPPRRPRRTRHAD